MSDVKVINFKVGRANREYYCSDSFTDYAEAEAYARKQAYADGEDFAIYSRLAIAKAPQAVNDVKVEKVS